MMQTMIKSELASDPIADTETAIATVNPAAIFRPVEGSDWMDFQTWLSFIREGKAVDKILIL